MRKNSYAVSPKPAVRQTVGVIAVVGNMVVECETAVAHRHALPANSIHSHGLPNLPVLDSLRKNSSASQLRAGGGNATGESNQRYRKAGPDVLASSGGRDRGLSVNASIAEE